ncbi:MAG: SH3 domain-containing protein [Eubacteriales bacterium]|nr:SH3 domain-containing protein [Eubacteriales bacterium]
MSSIIRRVVPALASAVLLTAFLPTCAQAAYRHTPKTICRTKANVHVRRGPGLRYSVKSTVRKGTKIKKIGEKGSWSAVKAQGSTCYVKSSYLKPLYRYVYVAKDRVNLRTGPGINYKIQTTLPQNVRLKCTGKTRGWMKVKYKRKLCYISASLVSSKKIRQETLHGSGNDFGGGTPDASPSSQPTNLAAPSQPVSNSDIRNRAIAAAQARLGDAYSQQYRNYPGFADCSSLIRDVFLSAAGVNVGETTGAQMLTLANYQKPLSALQAGDILMHIDDKGGNHVGLYIGNQQYIHASFTKKQVILSNYYPDVYWTCCYDAAAYCSSRQ